MTIKEIKKLFKSKFGELPPNTKTFQDAKQNYQICQTIANKSGGHYRKYKSLNHDFEIFKAACEGVA